MKHTTQDQWNHLHTIWTSQYVAFDFFYCSIAITDVFVLSFPPTQNLNINYILTQAVTSYFSLSQCIEGLKVLVKSLFGMKFVNVPIAPGESWHPDVLKMALHHPNEVHLYFHVDSWLNDLNVIILYSVLYHRMFLVDCSPYTDPSCGWYSNWC